MLKLAEAYVEIGIDLTKFTSGMTAVMSQLGRLKGLGTIPLQVNTSGATAAIGQVQQQIGSVSRAAASVGVSRVAGTGLASNAAGQGAIIPPGQARGSLMSRMGGTSGFLTGAAQGAGLIGFAASPAQMAGQMLARGVTEAVSGSVQEAVKMESNLATLERVSGLTAADMQKFQKTIFDIATSTPGNSPQDVIDIAMAGARAGVADKGGAPALEQLTRSIADIRGAVQGIGTEQLANDLGRIVGLYGEGTDKIKGYGSALVHLDNISKSTANDILSITVGLAATTNNLKGLPVEKVMALASGLKDAGVSNALAITSVQQILRTMGSKPENYAEALGMPKQEFSAIYNRDAGEALDLVVAKFKEVNAISPTAGQEWLTSLGLSGQRVGGVFQQLVTVLDDVNARAKSAKEETEKFTALIAAKEITGKTTETATGKLGAAFQELGVNVGSQLTPGIKAAADAAVPVVRGISNLIGGKQIVDSETGKVVSGGFMNVVPGATEEQIKDQKFLDEWNAKHEKARLAAIAAESPAGIRARQFAEVAAERAAAQARADAKAKAQQETRDAFPGGLGLPGMGPGYQDMLAAQEAFDAQPNLLKWGQTSKSQKLNPFQTDQFMGPTGVADFGMSAIKDAVVGKETEDMSKEQVDLLSEIRDIMSQIRDKKDMSLSLRTILNGPA